MSGYIERILIKTKESLLDSKSMLKKEREMIIDRLSKCDVHLIDVERKIGQIEKELEARK